MNKILASFTSSEKNLIVFVLLLTAGGYGVLEWRSHQRMPMVFDAEPLANVDQFSSAENVMPDGMDKAGRVDVNSAGDKVLETLPGIGPSLAGAILRHRKSHGPYSSMDDLDKVSGIGPAMMEKLAPLVVFGDVPDTVAPGMLHRDMPLLMRGLAPTGDFPTAPDSSDRVLVNINTAGPDELDRLKGIGPALAERIIQDRRVRGPYRSAMDLERRVKGIGPKILEENQNQIYVK